MNLEYQPGVLISDSVQKRTEEVLDALRQGSKGISKRDLLAKMKGKTRDKTDAIAHLEETGKIVIRPGTKIGKTGRKYSCKLHHLAESAPSEEE